jgi:ABC-type dipeptide/oligopeptide/nickel transport system ATPase component
VSNVVDIRNLEITFATAGGDVAAVQDVSLSAAAG